ncbi:MAG: DNA mismatch repair protein MutS, partial [Candidatus Aenigmarchaeota archaeon]|nr:DNA mismatch repair protein MutS [Candidatus Aenigmarchaeota archaeon]
DDDEVIVCSAGALITYLYDTQKTSLSQITKIRKFASDSYMIIDPSTLRNLEIVSNVRDGSCNGSLLSVIDRTLTPMGGRLLRSCILRPLMDAKVIKSRLDAVDSFCNDSIMKSDTREILAKVNDIERLVGKVSLGSANPRDLVALKRSIEQVPKLKKVISNSDSSYVLRCADFADLSEICKLIDDSIDEDSSLNLKLGHVIKGGYNSSVDELRSILHGGRDWIVRLEKKERERSGIKSLRVGFNKVFGYYIEITNTYKDKAPEDYIRKQTLANAERYITEELKQMEEKVLGAEERMLVIEAQIFSSVVEKICTRISDLQSTARNLASVDVVSSLADVAQLNNYIKPEVCEGYDLEINGGRHPVVEKLVDESFVSNDCSFSEKMKMMIITGCNMSGKSTFMRQVAIIQLLAQIGSFVPADSAKLGIVDRIFTRIGAFDDLSHGQSTFMVEMSETANIINNATERSLIVLDEIGRGTSTYDGVSIAWAVAEHIYQSIGAKTLFAT